MFAKHFCNRKSHQDFQLRCFFIFPLSFQLSDIFFAVIRFVASDVYYNNQQFCKFFCRPLSFLLWLSGKKTSSSIPLLSSFLHPLILYNNFLIPSQIHSLSLSLSLTHRRTILSLHLSFTHFNLVYNSGTHFSLLAKLLLVLNHTKAQHWLQSFLQAHRQLTLEAWLSPHL